MRKYFSLTTTRKAIIAKIKKKYTQSPIAENENKITTAIPKEITN